MNLKDYKLVWSEEFDGNSLNDTKFALKQDTTPIKNKDGKITYDYCDCQRVVSLKDGKLILNCFFDEERNCFVGPKPVQTKDTMSFKYGYLEIKAKMPYTHGAAPSIDAFAKGALGCEQDSPYYSHIKIIAPSEGQNMTNNLIKEYEDYNETNPFYEKDKNATDTSSYAVAWGVATPDSYHNMSTELVMDDFKTYGFFWTPKVVIFTVNGYVNARMSLTQDFLRPSGIEGFKKPHFLQFNNFLVVDNEKMNQPPTLHVTRKDVETQCFMEIEYVRLYQKDGEGELNLRK